MEVRQATREDIPEIVNLLKLSLGESLMPKSEGYWRWKHIRNPFGISPVLVCLEGSQLIGVRAFMRWEWIQASRIYTAVRAVDTATHPEYQGKGIFKKLTLSLVETCIQEDVKFVFNTPNAQSKPGYLKMKWVEAGKLPVRISPRKPFAMVKNLVKRTAHQAMPTAQDDTVSYYLHHAGLPDLLHEYHNRMDTMTANVTVPYLKWRYLDVPVTRYIAVGHEQAGRLAALVIGRIKDTRMGREFRITDYFQATAGIGKALAEKIKEISKQFDIDYITISGAGNGDSANALSGISTKLSIGPMVTLRSLSMSNLNGLISFREWSPSLGDLELF